MKTLEQIIAENRVAQHEQQAIEHKKTFETGLFTGLKVAFAEMLGTALRLVRKETYSVKVENQLELPKIQKVDGSVSLKEIKSLVLGLDEVVKTLKELQTIQSDQSKTLTKELKPVPVDFTKLEKAIQAIKIPETVIPEYPTVMQVSNLDEVTKALSNLASKFKIEPPVVNIPPTPKTITVGNLEAIETLLEHILTKVEPEEEKLIGFSWTKTDTGKLSTLTEIYPSGKVISKGWGIGRVTIEDDRER